MNPEEVENGGVPGEFLRLYLDFADDSAAFQKLRDRQERVPVRRQKLTLELEAVERQIRPLLVRMCEFVLGRAAIKGAELAFQDDACQADLSGDFLEREFSLANLQKLSEFQALYAGYLAEKERLVSSWPEDRRTALLEAIRTEETRSADDVVPAGKAHLLFAYQTVDSALSSLEGKRSDSAFFNRLQEILL